MAWNDPPDKGDWLLGFLIFITLLIITMTVILLLAGYHIKHKPTADQLYGCSYAQADPASGECR